MARCTGSSGSPPRASQEPDRVVLQRPIGTVVEARDDPERSFDGHEFETPWDDLHLAYFTGEALWTYLNTPFLFTWPGFVCLSAVTSRHAPATAPAASASAQQAVVREREKVRMAVTR